MSDAAASEDVTVSEYCRRHLADHMAVTPEVRDVIIERPDRAELLAELQRISASVRYLVVVQRYSPSSLLQVSDQLEAIHESLIQSQ